jgi:hypothetical protein
MTATPCADFRKSSPYFEMIVVKAETTVAAPEGKELMK